MLYSRGKVASKTLATVKKNILETMSPKTKKPTPKNASAAKGTVSVESPNTKLVTPPRANLKLPPMIDIKSLFKQPTTNEMNDLLPEIPQA